MAAEFSEEEIALVMDKKAGPKAYSLLLDALDAVKKETIA